MTVTTQQTFMPVINDRQVDKKTPIASAILTTEEKEGSVLFLFIILNTAVIAITYYTCL